MTDDLDNPLETADVSSKASIKAAAGGLCRSPAGVNRAGDHYVEIFDGILYVELSQVKEFKSALKELWTNFDDKFVPTDQLV